MTFNPMLLNLKASINGLKTLMGYCLSVIQRHTSWVRGSQNLERIYNYLKIDTTIATSGQPTSDQLQVIQQSGYQTIINLAPHSSKNALPDERSIVEALGMTYIYIPVDFNNPTEQDFNQFCQAMDALEQTPVFVHCAANMRVSAFIYRYRVQIRGEDRQAAINDLQKIWQPTGVWRSFLSRD